MPELPEVQTVVNMIRPKLLGRKIVGVKLERTDIVEPEGVDLPGRLLGRTIAAIERRGKRIIFTLDNTHHFFIHLGMTGRLTINSPENEVEKHTHLRLDVGDAESVSASTGRRAPASSKPAMQLRFRDPRRFGGIWWLGDAECDAGLGPEPLSVRAGQLATRLASTTRPIKNALLDQTVLAGLGNIYVDESLFASGIHPLTPANKLSAEHIAKLNRAIKTILRRAIRHRGSTLRDYRDANGNAGGFQLLHNVYGREGQACRVCKSPITRIVLGGRSTHFCVKCQPPANAR
jgi:formamidopyrimidine-DNA glycosylase